MCVINKVTSTQKIDWAAKVPASLDARMEKFLETLPRKQASRAKHIMVFVDEALVRRGL
jgi:hypothetical protein